MLHPETHTVTPENGPRPAGLSDECFYCNEKLGRQHRKDCVLRKRTVIMEYRFQVVLLMPEHWTIPSIEFNRNDGSWCASNALDELEEQGRDCWCNHFKAIFVREATENDESLVTITLET